MKGRLLVTGLTEMKIHLCLSMTIKTMDPKDMGISHQSHAERRKGRQPARELLESDFTHMEQLVRLPFEGETAAQTLMDQ